jgi:putative transcriptional regulator
MIRIKVAELMGRNKMNQKAVAEATGMRPNTVSQLWHGAAKRIEMDQIEALCKLFKCQPGDLFEYVEETE